MLRLLALFLLTPLAAVAQQIGTNATPAQASGFTLTVQSQLVVETVVVKDKAGHFLTGLSAKDFTITEDGVPQTIRLFERQKLPVEATPLPQVPSDQEQITIYKHLSHTRIAAEDEAHKPYTGHRLLALYFDMTALPPEDQLRALTAAEKFVRTQMTPVDLVSILRYAGGSVDVLQDFTGDRNRLLSILQTMIVGEGQGSMSSVDDASSADTGTAFGQDDSQFNVFNTDRQLSALQTAATMLGRMNEKKSLIYFASGLRLNGTDNQAQLRATIEAAVRSGVTFWPVDARGLVAQAPLGDATQGSPGNQGIYSGTAAQAVSDNFQHSQDTLYSLASDTGGNALFDNNDLTQGILQAQRSIEDYYILGYYTTNHARNGNFRRVHITVNPALGAKLSYREGYYAEKEFNKFTQADKERQLEDAMMLGDPITDLTVAMEINYFQLNRAEYFVPVVVKIPGRELALAKRRGAQHTLIDFLCEIKDESSGDTIANLRDHVDIKLSDLTAAQLATRPVEYDTGFTLTPGSYSIKFLARDDETGRIGTYQTPFAIPDLNRVTKRIPLSTVVLSDQRIDMKNALYNAARGKSETKDLSANPLVENGSKLIPSVTRVFSKNRLLYVYLQAYEGSTNTPTAPTAPLVAYVSFVRNGAIAFETPPIAVLPLPGSRLGAVPLNFSVDLAALPPGPYECQVSVLSPGRQRVSFWRGPLMLLP